MSPVTGAYVLDPMVPGRGRDTEIEHLNAVPWHQAPIPRRWHRCWAQTRGWVGLDRIERCACGAGRYSGRGWMERNSRRGPSTARYEPNAEDAVTEAPNG